MPETKKPDEATDDTANDGAQKSKAQPDEAGGPSGKEPTRYGDWERNGRCYDF